MPELKRSFQSGKMNKDLDERLVPNGEYRDALNIEISTSEEDDMGSAQTVKGNIQLHNKANPVPMPDRTKAPTNNNWSNTYRNKTVGSVVDDKTNWGYRLVSGPSPEEHADDKETTYIWRPYNDQVNYISADYIVRNNDQEEEPVLIDIYSVGVGTLQGWTIPTTGTSTITVPDASGLRLGMELEVFVNTPTGVSNAWIPGIYLHQDKLPKITEIIDLGGSWEINLNGEVALHNIFVNHLVFTAPRVLNFEHDNLITGLNIIDDFLLWTDNHSEPKKIHIEKSVLGSRHPFTHDGVNPLDWNKHTNFVTMRPVDRTPANTAPKFWLGEEDENLTIPPATQSTGGRPIKEKHITVIKEAPLLTPVLEMIKAEGDVNTDGRLLNNDDNGTPFNPFMDSITQTSINDEIWIGYGGPSSAGYFNANGTFIAGGLPCVGCATCPPPWTSSCTINFSIVPFYEAGDIVIFTVPGSSPLKQIRAEVLLGPDWNYGSYKIKILSKSGDIDNTDINWVSEIELIDGNMFEFKFPRFATRYKYEDGEYSTYSPWTQVAFLPERVPMDYLTKKGYNLNMTNNLKKLAIKDFVPHKELLPDDVEEIEIVYKESDSSNVYSVVRVPRNSKQWESLDSSGNTLSSQAWHETRGYVRISSEMIQGTIAPNQLLRHYDAVPRKAKAQEITGNRLLYGNYLQNYDLSNLNKVNCGKGSNVPCEGTSNVKTDIFFSITSKFVGGLQPEQEKVENAGSYGPAKSIKSLRTYQLGVVYRDEYGRETPVFSNIKMSKYLEKNAADNANHLAAAVKNILPDFVDSFRFFVKETSNEYYNLPMDRWYDAEDGNVWLSFPSSERSKISINTDEERFEDTFIILKKEHDSNNHVSNRDARYKVLAIENDAPNFIKTTKDSLGILEDQGAGIFESSNNGVAIDGFPTVGNNFVRIKQADFETMGWQNTLVQTVGQGDMKLRIGTDVIKSSWYKIISANFITGSNPSQYEIRVADDFGSDMMFSASTNLQVDIVEEKIKYLPEFDGRFFVKIYRDPTLEDILLTTGVPSVTQYQVTTAMLCQVIDPNSAWSTYDGGAYTPDGWFGWGTDNITSVSSTWAPTMNYQDANRTAFTAPQPGPYDWTILQGGFTPTPIIGPDWAISNNQGGQGEQFWQGFEGQDATFGNPGALASRWFIDARSGQHQMFQPAGGGTVTNMTGFGDWAPVAGWEIDNNGDIIGTPISQSVAKQRDFNAAVPSMPNNPIVSQGNRTDMISTTIFNMPWVFPFSPTEPGEVFNPDARFKSPSQGIYTDPVTNDRTIIDISCMGFGGPEANSLSFSTQWNQGTWLPYDNVNAPFASAAGLWNVNVNSPWLVDNAILYGNDIAFISRLTTPGTLWRWGEDPDGIIYETQNSNTQISDWINSGGTLGGWKRVGESSVHFNTQTIALSNYSFSANNTAQTALNTNNTYAWTLTSGTIVQVPNDQNGTGIFDVHSESASNTANWNRSQRWTIEARTQSGDELGSGPVGYLPTNDPRWSTSNQNFSNPNQFAPGVRHDGMGWGQQAANAQQTSTNATGVVNSPADYNASTGVTSGSFTWQILTPVNNASAFNSTGSFSSGNPAIWETEPRNNIDLDIYYEIGQSYASMLNDRTNRLHIPVGSEVRIYRPPDSTYVLSNPGTPTGWIDWPNNNTAFVESWNAFIPGVDPIDPTFPNEIRITDKNGNVMGGVTPFESPFPGDILVFYRADGSTTEAMVYEHVIPDQSPQFITNKLSGFFKLDESIANRYIRLPWFNCYSFGNGVESNRIRDDFNEVIIDKGPKASTTISKTYKEERKSNSLIFSGIYNSKTGINNLNQFIESEGITKDLNPTYGSIQKLYSRDTDIIALCEEKCLRILANKDALFNADGNINMIATPNVLGQAVAYAGDYGISKNPESFAAASFRMYFTDKSKGTVLRLSQDGLTPISNVGMSDWFTDNLKNAYEIIGSFDERKGNYNLTVYDHNLDTTANGTILKLGSNTVSYNERVKGWSSFKSFAQEQGYSLNNDYFTAKHGNIWKHHEDSVFRNNFYTEQFDSSITLLFNESPGSVKSFNTLNYEGSQARITRDITSNPDSIYVPDYYDNFAYDGWYVSEITTNLQETDYLEFKSKEDKWFSQIKGVSTDISNIDPREFSYQGIDEAMVDPSIQPCIWGCTDPLAVINYNPSATCDDGSCIYCVYGCTDSDACNYDPNATCDDGSCLLNFGCTDPMASNYDPNANCDDGSCIYPTPCTAPVPGFISGSGKVEMSCGKFMQAGLMFHVDTFALAPSTTNPNYNYKITDSFGNVISTGSNMTSGNTIVVQPIVPIPANLPNSTDYYIEVTDDNGCTSTNLLTALSSQLQVYGCTDSIAINYNANATCDDGSCIVPGNPEIPGCMDSTAINYDCATSINPNSTTSCNDGVTLDDGTCVYKQAPKSYGCLDAGAANYNAQATAPCDANNIGCDNGGNGTCTGPGISGTSGQCCAYPGCTDPVAGNYDSNANVNDGSCIYPGCTYGGTSLPTWTNIIGDGGSNSASTWASLYGSTDPGAAASNYDASATVDDGSCVWTTATTGCMDNGNKSQTWFNNNQYTGNSGGTYPNPWVSGPHPANPTIKGPLYPGDYGHGQATNYDPNATTMTAGSCTYNCMWHIYEHCETGKEIVFNTFTGGGSNINKGFSCSNNQSTQNWMNKSNANISAGIYPNMITPGKVITLKLNSNCVDNSALTWASNASNPCFKYVGLRSNKQGTEVIHIKGHPWVPSTNSCADGGGHFSIAAGSSAGCSGCTCANTNGPCT